MKDNTSSYSEKELSKFISNNKAEVLSILTDITTQLPNLQSQIEKLNSLVQSFPSSFTNGLSILDLKSQFLLSYNEYLLVYMVMKLEGIDLQSHPLFESLVRFRTLLEKLDPLELKMKTEIDNVLNPQTDSSSLNPLTFKPNLDDLDSASDSDSDSDKPSPSSSSKKQLYVPPKIAAVPYSERDAAKDEHRREQLRDKIASNAFISELRDEISDRPRTINMRSTGDLSLDRELKERKDFEESNFVRVNRTREQKKRERQASLALQRGQKIGEFDEFDSLTRLARESDKIAGQIVDEDEFGNRVKRVQVDERQAKRGGRRGKKGRR
ncbi:uncharacterized protein [Blastocystis hominis]|uniref:Sas10 C-terminal domain-containing protein n=1 Tax=Blastocystis hominis TaxID=12968 RepID=D8MAC8_BLAHO|nr:uncharacterized protein [Blastocystis hominis]CBK25017.2 unnamed protein product [Blastocystis hominis]|eukprot:XP_012899065.1 uncharacterized protein [Blastocystis hominis]